MGLSIKDIRNSNEKYYYKSYFTRVGRMQAYWFVFSIIVISLFQFAAYNIICEIIRQEYFKQAKFQSLGIEETGSWVNRKMNGIFLNNVFTIMLIATVFIILYTIITYIVNSIHMYRHKKGLLLFPVFVFIVEVLAVTAFNLEVVSSNAKNVIVLVLAAVIKNGFEALISGITLPIEVKAPCIKIVNKIFDKSLENL